MFHNIQIPQLGIVVLCQYQICQMGTNKSGTASNDIIHIIILLYFYLKHSLHYRRHVVVPVFSQTTSEDNIILLGSKNTILIC